MNLTTSFAHGHEINGGNAAAADAIREASKTEEVILVAWEHVNIQYLTADLGVAPTDIPEWKSSDFDTVYVLTLDAAGKLNSFAIEAQNYSPCSTERAYTPCK